MDYKFFLYGIKNIIINPAKAWETTYSEIIFFKVVRNSLLFPLIVLVSVSAVVGSLVYTNSELPLLYSIFVGIKCFILFYFTVYASSYILREITYPLDLGKNFNLSFIIIVYSITPFLICQILSRLFESLLFVNIIGLYGLYVFWISTEKILTPPQYKKMPLLIAATISFVTIYILTSLVLTMLTDRVYYAFFA
jgi:hypothetical protein